MPSMADRDSRGCWPSEGVNCAVNASRLYWQNSAHHEVKRAKDLFGRASEL